MSKKRRLEEARRRQQRRRDHDEVLRVTALAMAVKYCEKHGGRAPQKVADDFLAFVKGSSR